MTPVICYIPNKNDSENINYICSDHKIHIRFRDYNQRAYIAGFEQKLTYLISYLMNYSYLPQVINMQSSDKLVKDFLNSADILTINNCIKNKAISSKYKGLKVKSKYTRNMTNSYKCFGDVKAECFPVFLENDILKASNLEYFLSSFKISLSDYLFNDNYIIIITDINTSGINKKFINRMHKKTQYVVQNNATLVELW